MYTVYWIHYTHETDIATEGYVGCTSNLKSRIQQHQSDVRRNRDTRPLVRVIKEHGTENVQIDTILEGTQEQCLAKEFELRPEPAIGWNDRAGGRQVIHSDQALDAMSKGNSGKVSARKGVRNSPEHVSKMVATRIANGSYTQTEETKAKISAATSYEKSHAAVRMELVIRGTAYTYDCIKRCCAEHNLNYSTVRSRLRKHQTHEIKGYSVRYL